MIPNRNITNDLMPIEQELKYGRTQELRSQEFRSSGVQEAGVQEAGGQEAGGQEFRSSGGRSSRIVLTCLAVSSICAIWHNQQKLLRIW
jgi:hypothetical protein